MENEKIDDQLEFLVEKLQVVHDELRKGPLRAVRVSSAQARGYAKQYSYWGAARYRIEWSAKHQWPVAIAVHAASSDRRSYSLAVKDAKRIAEEEGRFLVSSIGRLTQREVSQLADEILSGNIRRWVRKK